MNRMDRFWQRVAEGADLETEALPGQSIVEICGDCRVLVENHRGIWKYSREQIGVRLKSGMLTVEGLDLVLGKMSRERLIIRGQIRGVSLCKEGGK